MKRGPENNSENPRETKRAKLEDRDKGKEKIKENETVDELKSDSNPIRIVLQNKLMSLFREIDMTNPSSVSAGAKKLIQFLEMFSDPPLNAMFNFNEPLDDETGLTPLHVMTCLIHCDEMYELVKFVFKNLNAELDFNAVAKKGLPEKKEDKQTEGFTPLWLLIVNELVDFQPYNKEILLKYLFSNFKLTSFNFNALIKIESFCEIAKNTSFPYSTINFHTPLSLLARVYTYSDFFKEFLLNCVENIPLELDFTVIVAQGGTIKDILAKSDIHIIARVDFIISLRAAKDFWNKWQTNKNEQDLTGFREQFKQCEALIDQMRSNGCGDYVWGYRLLGKFCLESKEVELFKGLMQNLKKGRGFECSVVLQHLYNTLHQDFAMKLWGTHLQEDIGLIEKESKEEREKRMFSAFEIAQKDKSEDGKLLTYQIGFSYVTPKGLPSVMGSHPLYDAIREDNKSKISFEALKLLKRNKKLEKQRFING